MARSAFSTVMWVGRATVFMVGLAVVLALLFGVATTALGATGGNFILGQSNAAAAITRLASNVAGGPAMQISNSSTEAARLERHLSDLVNEAYGLTVEEVDLLCKTAPPRMPRFGRH